MTLISLEPVAGIPAAVDSQSGRLELGADFVAEEWGWRTLDAARDVYLDPPVSAPPLYHMANGITRRDNLETDSPLRYELTSLRPGTIGGEWVKTVGHLHNEAPGGLGYPETYEVIVGEALFVLFRPDLAECLLVHTKTGERFVIPPGWYHLAVNAGDEAMVFADVVARAVAPDYSLLRRSAGAPFYLGSTGPWRNLLYPEEYQLRHLSATDLPPPVAHGRLADTFFCKRYLLDYLLKPATYAAEWDSLFSTP